MTHFLKKLFVWCVSFPHQLMPELLRMYAEPQRYYIDRFFHTVMRPQIAAGERVLDAGAGPQRYKSYLTDTAYESTDFEDVFAKETKSCHNFICSLDDIPKADASYDVIINTEVLEHVSNPQKVIDEFYRILAPGGRLFLTTPQMFPVHCAPYNYFFYSRYGLRHLFETSGFKVVSIVPNGGIFVLLAKICSSIPAHLFFQAVYGGHKTDIYTKPQVRSYPLGVLLLPFYMLARIIFYLILPPIFFLLDRLDRQKDYTLGYCCVAVKEGT